MPARPLPETLVLIDALREALGHRNDVEERTLFGSYCFFLDSKLCLGVKHGELWCACRPSGMPNSWKCRTPANCHPAAACRATSGWSPMALPHASTGSSGLTKHWPITRAPRHRHDARQRQNHTPNHHRPQAPQRVRQRSVGDPTMPIRIVRLGTPRTSGEGLRIGTVRRRAACPRPNSPAAISTTCGIPNSRPNPRPCRSRCSRTTSRTRARPPRPTSCGSSSTSCSADNWPRRPPAARLMCWPRCRATPRSRWAAIARTRRAATAAFCAACFWTKGGHR